MIETHLRMMEERQTFEFVLDIVRESKYSSLLLGIQCALVELAKSETMMMELVSNSSAIPEQHLSSIDWWPNQVPKHRQESSMMKRRHYLPYKTWLSPIKYQCGMNYLMEDRCTHTFVVSHSVSALLFSFGCDRGRILLLLRQKKLSRYVHLWSPRSLHNVQFHI